MNWKKVQKIKIKGTKFGQEYYSLFPTGKVGRIHLAIEPQRYAIQVALTTLGEIIFALRN